MRGMIAVLALLGAAQPAFAQEPTVEEGWRVNVGAGGFYAPSYDGDDDYRLSVLPSIQVNYGDTFFASVENGVGYRWINGDDFRAGPIARVQFSRKEDGEQSFAITGDDTNDLLGLGDVDASFELGGFVEYELGPVTLSAEARKAISGHEGLVADFEAQWSGRASAFGIPMMWSVGPRARVVDEDYNTAYFGVTGAQAIASGLPVYEAGGGLYSYGVGANAIIPLSRDLKWAAIVFAGYDRLSGDAGNSPLVQLRGSEDQLSAGVFVSYRLY
jgi:outer membrane protein